MIVKTINSMKRFILLAVFAVTCLSGTFLSAKAQVAYKQNVNDFDRIEIYGDVYVEMAKADSQTARVEATGISKEDLDISIEKQTLRIKLKPRIYNEIDVKVFVTYRMIREIKTAGGALLVVTDTINGDKLIVDALTSATVRLQVDINNLELKAGQGATISVKGKVETLEASAGSKGLVAGYELIATKTFASCSLGGTLKIHPTDYLEAKANVGGAIYYINRPKQVKISQNLGGKVEEVLSMEESSSQDSL